MKWEKCLDCYQAGQDRHATERQKRRKLEIPCCRDHFYAYKNRVNQADAKKYARRSAEKRQKRLCARKGCKNNLIPQELLPPWIERRTCGLHSGFKAFGNNRTALLRFIIDHCLTPEERIGMIPQSVAYRRGDPFLLFGYRQGQGYTTVLFGATTLLSKFRRQNSERKLDHC